MPEEKPWEGAYSTSWGIRPTCDDIGVTPARQTFAEVFTVNSTTISIRIAKKSDSTRIYVRRTIPEMPE